jgi:hypothetical protein
MFFLLTLLLFCWFLVSFLFLWLLRFIIVLLLWFILLSRLWRLHFWHYDCLHRLFALIALLLFLRLIWWPWKLLLGCIRSLYTSVLGLWWLFLLLFRSYFKNNLFFFICFGIFRSFVCCILLRYRIIRLRLFIICLILFLFLEFTMGFIRFARETIYTLWLRFSG